jgi:hypothetical protein
MKSRCYNKNNPDYHYYGGRGVIVCKEWLSSFEDFYQDMGPKPKLGYSLDRINNNKNYSPDNCKWSTWTEQANNRRKPKE